MSKSLFKSSLLVLVVSMKSWKALIQRTTCRPSTPWPLAWINWLSSIFYRGTVTYVIPIEIEIYSHHHYVWNYSKIAYLESTYPSGNPLQLTIHMPVFNEYSESKQHSQPHVPQTAIAAKHLDIMIDRQVWLSENELRHIWGQVLCLGIFYYIELSIRVPIIFDWFLGLRKSGLCIAFNPLTVLLIMSTG